MSSAARQSGSKILRSAGQAAASADERGGSALRRGAKRDPELYVLLSIMAGAFGLVGWFFGSKPTATSEETKVGMAAKSMPWQDDGSTNENGGSFKYKYHPGGDPKKPPKEAPSALHSVIVPNVTLPKHLHDRFNKYGRDDW
ncbi:MAG: Eukaryotic peptide chain release factor GTP-binding subunit [Watsoniomyces obsoletus]|nr:MAG: Eukaryotic peptide chain release factor GTP-binding subunit [Watsoniomyces obsoletus]